MFVVSTVSSLHGAHGVPQGQKFRDIHIYIYIYVCVCGSITIMLIPAFRLNKF